MLYNNYEQYLLSNYFMIDNVQIPDTAAVGPYPKVISLSKTKQNAPTAAPAAQLHLFRGTATAMAMA